MSAITQFTINQNNYPFGIKGFSAIDTFTPGILKYTFTAQKAAEIFVKNITEWASLLPQTQWEVEKSRPFEQATNVFPADPSIEVFTVKFSFPDIKKAYEFSQKVGAFGSQELDVSALPHPRLVRSSTHPPK